MTSLPMTMSTTVVSGATKLHTKTTSSTTVALPRSSRGQWQVWTGCGSQSAEEVRPGPRSSHPPACRAHETGMSITIARREKAAAECVNLHPPATTTGDGSRFVEPRRRSTSHKRATILTSSTTMISRSTMRHDARRVHEPQCPCLRSGGQRCLRCWPMPNSSTTCRRSG